jgi:hypothetical protein
MILGPLPPFQRRRGLLAREHGLRLTIHGTTHGSPSEIAHLRQMVRPWEAAPGEATGTFNQLKDHKRLSQAAAGKHNT